MYSRPKSSERVLSAVRGSIIAVCGTLWYVPRNAQSSPGGRRRQCRFNIVELTRWKFCAQEAKLPPWEAASLSEVSVQAAPLSSPIEVTLHLYVRPEPVYQLTHIGKVLWPQYWSLIQLRICMTTTCERFNLIELQG